MPKKILVIDDEHGIVDFLSHFLQRLNIDCLRALDGESAIDIYKKEKPDWVLLDIKMPGRDGFEVLKELKKNDPNAKVIMLTGKADKEAQAKANELGATDYLIKPLDLEELHKKIKTHILV